MLWCRHCKGQHALFPGQHWCGGLAVAPKNNRQPGVFRPESHEFLSQNLYPESTSDFVRSNSTFFWDMSCFWKVWCSGWKHVRKLCFMAKRLSTQALRWRQVEEALAGHSEGTLSWMCHEELMIVAVQDHWNCSYMSMLHCFRQWSATVLYNIIILYYITLYYIILFCFILYQIIIYYVLYYCIINYIYFTEYTQVIWIALRDYQKAQCKFWTSSSNGFCKIAACSVGFVSQLQGFVPNFIFLMIEEKGRIWKYYNDNDHYKWWWLYTHIYI